jgi:hypothetical protein
VCVVSRLHLSRNYAKIIPVHYCSAIVTSVAEPGRTAVFHERRGKDLMQSKAPKIVLLLIVLMAVLSPFMQLDSLDDFPNRTGDVESHLISVLFETGMFFVIAGILKLLPGLLCTNIRPPAMIFSGLSRDVALLQSAFCAFAVPLRI